MKRSHTSVLVAALVSVTLLATGCGTKPAPAPTGAPTTEATAAAWTQTFDYSFQGNTAKVTVSIGVPRKALNGLRNGSFQLGKACQWNYDSDGAIPVTITFTNTTAGVTADGVVHWGVVGAGDDVSAELGYSDNPTCATGADLASTQNSPGIRWGELAPNVTGTHVAFIRVGDFVTAAAPNGDLTKLKNAFLQIVNVQLGTFTLYAGGNTTAVPRMSILAPA
jgi:hypothetical protein